MLYVMQLVKALFEMLSFLSLYWNACFSYFASEVNTELKKMGIHRDQDLESVTYIPLVKLLIYTPCCWIFAIAKYDAFRSGITNLLTLW